MEVFDASAKPQPLENSINDCMYTGPPLQPLLWNIMTPACMSTHILLHSKKRTTCSGLMKTALNNVLLPTLFKVINNTEQVDEPELACNQV